MTEADVVLTDLALSVECAGFALWLRARGARGPLGGWLVALFSASAAAPLLGGTYHALYADAESAPGARVLWPVALFAVGAVALSCWALAAQLALPERWARLAVRAAALELAAYAVLLALGWQSFFGAVAVYLPAVLCLLLASLRRSGVAALGLAVTIVAAVVQQAHVGLHALGLSHNAVYHSIQAAGFALFFAGSRRWATAPRPPGR